MHGLEHGVFEVADERLAPGVRYGFSLDGGPTLPDPRSRSQPDGVHAASELFDPSEFLWTDRGFRPTPFERAVLYELHVGTWSEAGTFDGAIAHLDHLVRLGASHVELMPVAAFPLARGWGYDGVYPFAVHAPYGGPRALQRFVDACHSRGIAVLLDVVYNHLGPSGCYLARYAPYFTSKYRTPWGEALNFDGPGSDFVRRFVCDNALYLLEEFHLDGLRLDAVQEIFDASPLHILEQLQLEVEALSARLEKPLVLMPETPANDPRLLGPRERGGYGIRAQWNDDFHHALCAVLTKESAGYYADYGRLSQLARAVTEGYVYQGEYSAYRKRRHGRKPEHVDITQFVVFAQNHDQVGNRPTGDRLGDVVGIDQQKQAAALVLLAPSVPLLFMGQEWGASTPFQYFIDHSEPELAHAVASGRARESLEFGWPRPLGPDPRDEATFQSSKLRWSEIGEGAHADLLAWHTELLRLRREALTTSNWPTRDYVVRYDEPTRCFALRVKGVSALFNFGRDDATLATATLDLGGIPPLGARRTLASGANIRCMGETVSLPPGATLVWHG
jgi:maltooligosyltrehalose trehalohydrolase